MDNKVNKNRLSNFLSYEWITMIIVILVAIFALEFVYTVTATRATVGQQFKFYIDETVSADTEEFYSTLDYKISENGKTFSYDVLSLSAETLTSSNNMLSARLSIQEGDVIFTDASTSGDNGSSRAKTIVDDCPIYTLDKLLSDAENYLSDFMAGGELDDELIISHFNERMKHDNRFRSEKEKEIGRSLEIERIYKLKNEVNDFRKILSSENENLFFRYTKYEYISSEKPNDSYYQKMYEKEISEGRISARYGINISELTYDAVGKTDVSRFFRSQNTGTAEGVVVMVFDFLQYQPDLQFETISFINSIFRTCSNFLDD